VHDRRRRHQPIDYRQRPLRIEPSPTIGHGGGDRNQPVAELALERLQPPIDRLGLSAIAATSE
jgi:hypothetical protein